MIKRYTNFFYFIKELPALENCLIIFPHDIEKQINRLGTKQYRALKNQMEKQNIKYVIEKESVGIKEYEKNKYI